MTEYGDNVFDPYMGVGSSVIAALKHGRQGYGCDVVEEYVEIAWDRVRALQSGTLSVPVRWVSRFTILGSGMAGIDADCGTVFAYEWRGISYRASPRTFA